MRRAVQLKRTNLDLALRAHKMMREDTILLSNSPQEFFWEEDLDENQRRESSFRKFYELPKVLPQYVGKYSSNLDDEIEQYEKTVDSFRKNPTEESRAIARALFAMIAYAASTNYTFSAKN